MLQPEYLSCAAEGSLVVLRIGNTPLVFEYEAAIQTSTWLKVCSQGAKRNSGDRRRHLSAIGVLSTLEGDHYAPPRPIHLRVKDVVDPQRIRVYTEGELVVFEYGTAAMKMDHEAGAKLAQWLRVRGKEAQRNAGGDTRHWTEVGNLAAVLNGEVPWGDKQ